MNKLLIHYFTTLILLLCSQALTAQYHMPEEIAQHEGTWLQWPHNYTYGAPWKADHEAAWIEMTRALVTGENVHIVAYNAAEMTAIQQALTAANVPLTNIDFHIYPTDDYWVRDNGPIYVYDNQNNLYITDWGFNGWGNDATYTLCDVIPDSVSQNTGVPRLDVNAVVLEGGSIEIDGNGSMMATRSSITGTDRNPGLTEAQIESYMTQYLGITNFLWLDGVAGLEITDMHIDGFMKFHDSTTIVCMDSLDLVDVGVPAHDITSLFSATNVNGNAYNYVIIPATANNVVTTAGQNLGYKGSYANYYIANSVVLVPNYNDPNDAVANGILQNLYPNRTVVGIDCRNAYANGGMVHCVTQQQPVNLNTTSIEKATPLTIKMSQNFPNPSSNQTTIHLAISQTANVALMITNMTGATVQTVLAGRLGAGSHQISIATKNLAPGLYNYTLIQDNQNKITKTMIVK